MNSKNLSKESIQHIRNVILLKLNDTQFHSGEDLARELSLSRSAISNHIKALCSLGLEIYSVKGRGYKLASHVDLLSHDKICATFSAAQKQGVWVKNCVTSTNDIVKQALLEQKSDQVSEYKAESGLVCLAEAQSAGRGRRGRTWVSPFGSSLYLSMLWHFDNGYQAMAGLSLMVGVVLNQTLRSMGIKGCQLKWPNDVYYQQQKLAGILIEVEGQVGASAAAIIGVGVNISLPNNISGIDQAYTDIAKVMQNQAETEILNVTLQNRLPAKQSDRTSADNSVGLCRNTLAKTLIENLWQALPTFENQGLAPFLPAWKKSDLYINKRVVLIAGDKKKEGISRGIDENGALLLESNGAITPYHGGEISVRPI